MNTVRWTRPSSFTARRATVCCHPPIDLRADEANVHALGQRVPFEGRGRFDFRREKNRTIRKKEKEMFRASGIRPRREGTRTCKAHRNLSARRALNHLIGGGRSIQMIQKNGRHEVTPTTLVGKDTITVTFAMNVCTEPVVPSSGKCKGNPVNANLAALLRVGLDFAAT